MLLAYNFSYAVGALKMMHDDGFAGRKEQVHIYNIHHYHLFIRDFATSQASLCLQKQ